MSQAQRIEQRIHILHAHAIDQDIGRAIVADCDHHGRQIAQRDARDSGSEPAHDGTVWNQIGSLHRVHVGELQLAGLRLTIKFSQHGCLDGTGLRENFVAMQNELLPARQVKNRNAQHAVQIVIDIVDTGFELLPQDFLLSYCRIRASVRDERSERPAHRQSPAEGRRTENESRV